MVDFIYYSVGDKRAKVTKEAQEEFEKRYPDAKMHLTYNGHNAQVSLSSRDKFLSKYGADNITYSAYDDNKQYSPDLSVNKYLGDTSAFSETEETKSSEIPEDDKPSGFESFAKGAGAGLARTAQYAVDLGNLAFKNSVIGKPIDWIRRATDENHGDVDTELRDENNLVTRLTTKLGETADRWSREADPTGGEQGYADLLKEGKYGMAAQKAMAQGLESAPFMVAAATGLGGALYAGGMAATTYANETRENPDIPSWKRAANAIGSAGLELAVEKIGGPLKNLFGGAGKMTTEAAKELIEKAAKEGAENIAERIARGLGRIGKKTIKEGIEEGGEEVLTSFGNDALGEALDIIDGDKDYGIRAQWEKYKEENPDASRMDFAKMKGKEYMESFLGGALSGAEISGLSSSVKEVSDARAHNKMEKFKEYGTSLNYNNMYDLHADISEAVDNTAKAFVDNNGEATIDRNFIENLSAEEAFALSRNEELSANQRTQMGALANIKAMREGMEASLSERLEKAIATDRAIIEEATENGDIVTAVYNNKPVYVKGVSISGGNVILPNGPIIIIDKSTGVASTVNSNKISSPQVKDANSYVWEIEGKWRQADMSIRERAINTMSPRAKMKAVSQYTGKKMMADFGNGIIEVGVQEILPEKGVVVLKGKKGDLGGQSIIEMGADVFYDSLTRDDAGNPMFAEGEIETEVEPEDTNVETPQEAEVTEEDDFRDTVAPILINGVPVEVEVVSQDNATNRIVYRYTDENGQERTGTASIGEFKTALQQAQEYKPEEPIVPEVPTEPTVEATTEPTPAPTDVPTEIEPVAEEINWDALFEQDQEAFFAELQKQFGEETLDILNEFVSAAQEELDSLNKKKRSSNPNDILATRNQKTALQKRIDAYNQMIARITPAPEAPVVEEPTSETPVETATTEEPIVEPAPTETTTVEPEPSVVSEPTPAPQPTLEPQPTPQPAPAPKPTAVPKPKPIGQVEQQRGNAINRLFEEFKENAVKIAKKIGMKDFVSTDKLRPAMTGVYREGGYEFASDGNILAKIKTSYPVEQEGKIFSTKTGQEIEGRYPKANEVIDSHRKNAIKVEVNVDDILAYSQTLEEIRKGLNRDKLYVKVGDRIFNAQALLKAAKMAKLHGLSEIYMSGDSRAPIIFVGENGVILAMPYQLGVNDKDILDVSTGKITFNDFSSPKVPTTLKGIEATRVALESVIPNYDNEWIDVMKSNGLLRLEDGKVFYSFDKGDISSVKDKAKDPNTYNALEAIEKNGLEVPLSDEEIAKIFPEAVTDSQVNSVPLENEQNGENNGPEGETASNETEGQGADNMGGRADNEGTNAGEETIAEEQSAHENSDNAEGGLDDKYPPRKGDVTPKDLENTFGFKHVATILPQSVLNSSYDVFMGMAKMLGISPKSITHGGELRLAKMDDSAPKGYDAAYSQDGRNNNRVQYTAIKLREGRNLAGVAHEWWHSLDHMLRHWNSGRGSQTTTNSSANTFDGRPEVLSAVKDLLKAIKDSGHISRIDGLGYSSSDKTYLKSRVEQTARAFEEYIIGKFAEAGITIEGVYKDSWIAQPTAEEMKIIAPAFDNLFKVLQEKEGRNPGSSVLYHIGEMMEQNNEAKNQLGALVADWIKQGGNFVVMDNEAMLNALEESGNARMLETPDGVIYGFVKDGVVYLNPSLLNANTSIHEYTHLWDNALMQLNRPLWEKGKALMKKTALWKEVVNDPNYADIKDNEDLVASEVHSRLVGTEGAKRLEQLEQEAREKGLTKGAKDLSILGRLREWLKEATQWLKDTFSVWSKEEIDAVSLDDFLNMPLRDLANFTALPQTESGQITNENGDIVANNNGNGHIQFSISTWREGGRDYLANWLANDTTLAEDEKADILARMDEFYENAQKYTDVYVPFGTWSEAAVKYDKDGNPLMSVIKANGDYSMNLDFSLVCKKRRPLNMLLRELINRNAFASYTLRERELAEINWILQEHGFEVACALCFVDAKRFRVTGVADVFATLYNRFVKALAPDSAQIAHFNYSNNPNVEVVENGIDTMSDEQLNWKKFDALAKKYGPKTVEGKVAKFLRENPSQRRLVDATDFIDANGFEAVKEGNPTLLSLYNSKKGTGGPKASFGDVQYLNDILKKEKSFDVEKAYAVGGVRLQSFSDFVPHMYFDYMQLFAELAAKKLPAHAYTKEVLFAKIFGMTGIKINMSLVPSVVEGGVAPGLDANGNYAWADAIKDKDGNVIQQAQSFPFDEAMAIQNAEGYSKNCGVIAVGISDAHILKMLNDPNIPFIIPYHKSSLNAIVARMTNIDQYKDYTNVQNTRKADGTKLAKGTPDFNFNAYLRENPEATPQQAAQAYLDWCKEHNYRPKFSQFASHPNYYKLLQDFNTIDAITGEYTPQGAVTMTFPTEQSEFGNVESLIQQGLQEDAELEEKMSSEISSIADKVIDRLKEIENEPKLSEKKYAEQMAKLADERMARIKERAEDDGILSRSGDITPEMDAAYMEAVERGDMETAQRMVDEAANKYLNEMLLPDDSDEVGFKYHRGPAPTKTFKRYAVFNVKDGGFHAAYAGNATPTPVGVWLDAQNLQSYVSDKTTLDNGTPATYVKGDTGFDIKSKFSDEKAKEYGLKGTKMLLERGGKHSSDVPNFSQMNLGKDENGNPVKSREKDGALPHNKLIFEIEYGISDDGDLTEYVKENGRKIGGKNQGLAKIEPNQYYDFKTNPNAVGNWGIGGTFRITRLVPHSEVVSVTEQYKKDAIAEANRMYENGEISKKDRDARVKSAEAIQVQKWVGGYNPADFGLSEDIVSQMAEEGSKMKLTDAVTYDDNGNVIPLSERFNPEKKDIRYRKSDIQNAAVDYLAGEPRNRAIENAVNEEAAKLGVTVTYKTRSEMPNGHKNDKGYYNTKTGEIVVCTENNADINDAIQTIIHEAVAHKGLRQLMGDRFNEFINRVYDALDAETKAKVDELATKHYNGNKAVAMEEYMATLAESENFAETSAWDKIKSIFEKIINSILGRNDIKIGDNELRYILRASYANMVNPRNMETIEGWAKDTNMREEYKINEATPEILSRTDIDPTVVATETARAVYDRTVASVSQEFQRQFQDAYQPVRIAIDAIQQETGNQPIEDYENYLLIQNQSSSRSRVEIDDFSRLYYSPIIDQVNMLIDAILESRGFNKKNKAERSRAYREVRQYLIAKHGLERNAYYQTRNTRLIKAKTKAERVKSVREDHKDIVDKINNDPTLSPAEKRDLIKQEKKRRDVLIKQIRETDYELDVRDYSGLTALFGLDGSQFEQAEDLAKELVENFERENGAMTEELWKRINKATNKTLKHSYECGLLSRQQYNEIKSMFEFYIPLRGFDETTAEDVYSYARFEGNKFNPAVAKTGGRTSLADDPLALIMNMAESEIAQGNKNRAKQALYNFLLNRVDGMDTQNSLMQIESVWYLKTVDGFGNELYVIAAPDHEAGETHEDFEERMKVLEEAGLAKRSKKGNVDVGMRFQKEKNKGSHYIYLKVNGVEKAIYINGDPKAADAVNGVYSEQYGEGLQKIRDIQRAVSSTFTNYSLEFTARNYFRDMVYSHINIGVRESDPAYRKKFRQNWRHNNIKTMLKMLKAYRAGELDNRALTEDEAAFVEFMRNGGQTGYTLINSVENHKKDLERAIRRMQKGIEKGGIKDSTVFKATLGGIELLNEASELVTRFAAFKTSRDMGRDINTSISDTKEVTVNFNTKGAQDGKGFFGIVARYLGAFKYFFNASVQGVQNLWAMMLSNKIKFGTVVGSTIAFGAMMPLIQGALAALLGDDDDENEYWNIPEYERQNNLCFVLGGGKYAKLPLPIGFREMYGLGDMMAAAIANRKVTRDPLAIATDVSNKIASIVLPINPLEGAANGLSLVESGTNMLLPDLTQGLIQNRTNVDFKGDPIQKEYTYNENDPQWTKAFSNNPAWIKGLCKWMNENIVIDGVGLDVSPEKLDNTFSNILGGVYSLVKKSGRAISMIWNEDNRHISNFPLIGVMVGTGIDEDDRFVNSSYWDMNDYYKSRLPHIKTTAENFGYSLDEVFKRVEEGETRAGAHHPKMSKIYNRENFEWMQEWYLGHKGEGETDENGEPILGIDQYKNKIKYLEKKIKKNENGEPTPEQAEELAKLNADYNKALEGFVYDMLEFD